MNSNSNKQEPCVLVTQSFGRESEYRRVALMILSYYAYSSDQSNKTLLFTDNPQWFDSYFIGLPVSYVLLTPPKIKEMRGDIDFLHRMKIALIEEAFQKFDANILYADSDTFFTGNPDSFCSHLAPEKSFMHVHEYPFEDIRNMPLPAGESFQAFVKLIESREFELSGGKIKIDTQFSSWNAGVMMLHKSHAKLIQDVYSLTNQFYPSTQNHASEQYAFSILLQSKTNLSPCDAVIYHYWYNVKKRIMDDFLAVEMDNIYKAPSLEKRLSIVKEMTNKLPALFDSHVYTLKDNAVQAFNKNEFGAAYKWAFKAFGSGAFKDKVFIKDVLYHFKRQLLKR